MMNQDDIPTQEQPAYQPKPVPKRFLVSKATLWCDRIMTKLIIGGGFTVIVAVFGILFFLLAVTLPLFKEAEVLEDVKTSPVVPTDGSWGLDASGKRPYLFRHGKEIDFLNQEDGTLTPVPFTLPDNEQITAYTYHSGLGLYPIATDAGKVGLITVKSGLNGHGDPDVETGGKPEVKVGELYPVTESGEPIGKIIGLTYADAGDKKVFVTLHQDADKVRTFVMSLEQSRSLVSDGELEPTGYFELSEQIDGKPSKILANMAGDGIVVVTDKNEILYFAFDENTETWNKKQTIKQAFGNDEGISVCEWLFGDMSFVLGGKNGSLSIFSLYPQTQADGTTTRLFGKTKEFEPLNGPITHYISSYINRSFLVTSPTQMKLCYGTTADTRWEEPKLNFSPIQVVGNHELTSFLAQDAEGKLHRYSVDDKHPESGTKALVGKIWYEGYDAPKWMWQSVGGTDDYESKISLMPLIFGTLKGTFYALIFAVPVALLAAVYTSHFMPASVKKVVKPLMEIMASLPSVVLGFFGALYLAPKMEDKVPAIIMMAILIPAVAILFAWFWTTRPIEWRNKISHGLEYIVMIPVILIIAWVCWCYLGYWVEEPIVDMVRGVMSLWGSGDFQGTTFPELWRNGFDMAYEQRNSLVVGFIMGFAVIPVIFTISEDALSNVPPSLIAASEALGASRWQIVKTIVIPIASAGIFSALMIGLGRAVGETMIVLMATGNTPIMDWNIFNGMRTLSANIATELPVAAQGSTHYRVLFLGGLILFSLTFVLNTIAEIVRQRLRKRYHIV